MLELKGYNGMISIEYEGCMISAQETFEKAAAHFRTVLINEKAGEAWWLQ